MHFEFYCLLYAISASRPISSLARQRDTAKFPLHPNNYYSILLIFCGAFLLISACAIPALANTYEDILTLPNIYIIFEFQRDANSFFDFASTAPEPHRGNLKIREVLSRYFRTYEISRIMQMGDAGSRHFASTMKASPD